MRATVHNKLNTILQIGDYNPGKNLLKYEDENSVVRHCVLGVLAEMYCKRYFNQNGKFKFHSKNWVPANKSKKQFILLHGSEIFNALEEAEDENHIGIYSLLNHTQTLPERILEWAELSSSEEQILYELNDQESYVSVLEYLNSRVVLSSVS